ADHQTGDGCILADHGLADLLAQGNQRFPGRGAGGLLRGSGGRRIVAGGRPVGGRAGAGVGHRRGTSLSVVPRASAGATSDAASCGGGLYRTASICSAGRPVARATAWITSCAPAHRGSPSGPAIRATVPARSAVPAWAWVWLRRYSRPRPRVVSVAL